MSDIQDAIPAGYGDEERRIVSHQPTPEQRAAMDAADREHDIKVAMFEEIAALKAELAARESVSPETTKKTSEKVAAIGGEPMPHHLHLVDGRVIADHPGIGTHYSEIDTLGNTKVTRVRAHYPADEPDPTMKYA